MSFVYYNPQSSLWLISDIFVWSLDLQSAWVQFDHSQGYHMRNLDIQYFGLLPRNRWKMCEKIFPSIFCESCSQRFFFREIDLLRHWFFQKGNPSNNQYKMCADIPNLSFWKLELPKNKFGIQPIYPKKFCWVRFEGRFWFFGHFGMVRLLWLRKIMSHVDQKNNVLTIFLYPIWNDEVKF